MNTGISLNDLFERRVEFPDITAQERLGRLVGVDQQKNRLAKILGILVNPSGLEEWGKKFHPDAGELIHRVLYRPPLVVLAGDVGTGKTEIAETIGDTVARLEKIDITLFPLSLSTRGQGRVGEMTQLVSAAFDHTIAEANKLKSPQGKARGGIILLIDEADALAQSREASQMHHEDRAGVNALIRGVDRINNNRLPAVVVMCTNRLGALDPAVKRRAAEILIFERPNEEQRRHVLKKALKTVGLSAEQIEIVVTETGPVNGRNYGFTYSDLTQRLLPSIVLDAYPNNNINPHRVLQIAEGIVPTPPFQEAL